MPHGPRPAPPATAAVAATPRPADTSDAARRQRAVRRALELHARRPRTESELRADLAHQFADGDIEDAITRLHALGYLDDAAWAAAYVARGRARERGAALLRRELLARGVSAPDAEEALRDHDDRAAAVRAARGRLRRRPARGAELDRGGIRRLRDHLRRRGFDHFTVESALAEVAGADADHG